MNRQQRRAGGRKRVGVGTMIKAHTVMVVVTTGERQLYWFEEPTSFSSKDADHLLSWIRGEHAGGPGVKLYGPFGTDAQVRENQRLVLLGPQCKVTEGGAWNPSWDKPQ